MLGTGIWRPKFKTHFEVTLHKQRTVIEARAEQVEAKAMTVLSIRYRAVSLV